MPKFIFQRANAKPVAAAAIVAVVVSAGLAMLHTPAALFAGANMLIGAALGECLLRWPLFKRG